MATPLNSQDPTSVRCALARASARVPAWAGASCTRHTRPHLRRHRRGCLCLPKSEARGRGRFRRETRRGGRQALLNASGYITPRRRATIAAKITGRVTASSSTKAPALPRASYWPLLTSPTSSALSIPPKPTATPRRPPLLTTRCSLGMRKSGCIALSSSRRPASRPRRPSTTLGRLRTV